MKHKRTAVTGMQIHNRREKKSLTNPDIDAARSEKNYSFEPADDACPRYIDSIDRRIASDTNLKRKLRSDAIYAVEFIATSGPDFFEGLSVDETRRYFVEARKYIAKTYGEKNIVWSSVHLDEKTPHLHCGIVPITTDGRLSAKDLFGGAKKLKQMQTDFHGHMTGAGFYVLRGKEELRQKHISKKRAAYNAQVDEVNERAAKAEAINVKNAPKIKKAYSDNKWLAKKLENAKSVDILRSELEMKKPNLLGKINITPEERDKIANVLHPVYSLQQISRSAEIEKERIQNENKEKSMHIRSQLEEEKVFRRLAVKETGEEKSRGDRLHKENGNLRKENREVKKENSVLRQSFGKIEKFYNFARDFFPEVLEKYKKKVNLKKEREMSRGMEI